MFVLSFPLMWCENTAARLVTSNSSASKPWKELEVAFTVTSSAVSKHSSSDSSWKRAENSGNRQNQRWWLHVMCCEVEKDCLAAWHTTTLENGYTRKAANIAPPHKNILSPKSKTPTSSHSCRSTRTQHAYAHSHTFFIHFGLHMP